MKNLIYAIGIGLLLSSCGGSDSKNEKNKDINFESTRTYKKDDKNKTTISGNVSRENLNFLPSSNGQIVKHKYYSLSYIEEHEQAEWVAYELFQRYTKGKNKRKDNFREDDRVHSGSASPTDYKGSGYDRGHLLPAADMKFSKTAMSETFFMSNMSPQDPKLNREKWRILEEDIRDWVQKDKHYFIITGPVIKTMSEKSIGTNQVTIPTQYYKVLFDYTEPEVKMIGFVMPNEDCDKDIFEYAVSVDEIEKITGLDFFSDLPDKIEIKLEKELDIEAWKNIK